MQANLISLNDFVIHQPGSNPSFIVQQDSTGFEFPDINRFSPYAKPGQSGSIVPNSFYDGRTITLNGRISGNTPQQYLQNKRNFLALLAIVANSLDIATPILLQFTTLDGLTLQCECFASQTPKYTEKSLNHGTYQVQLYAPDFNLYNQSQQVETVNLGGNGGLVFPAVAPFDFPANSGGKITIANNGNSNTWPVVTFYGPLVNPYVSNLTLGEQFQVDYSLVDMDVLVVDMINKTMVLNGQQNAMQYFDYLNTWMSLQPGNNVINFGSGLSSDTGHVVFSFADAYLSA